MSIEEIKEFCREFKIKRYTINDDLSIDVDGNVDLEDLGYIPVKFGKVDGWFHTNHCRLTTLKNAPHTVNGDFRCDYNELTSLEFAPKIVIGSFACDHNQLTSLEHFPDVKRFIYIIGNCFTLNDSFFEKIHSFTTDKGIFGFTHETIEHVLKDNEFAEYKSWLIGKERLDTIKDIIDTPL